MVYVRDQSGPIVRNNVGHPPSYPPPPPPPSLGWAWVTRVGLGSAEGGKQGTMRRRVGSLTLDVGCMSMYPNATYNTGPRSRGV